MRTDFDEFWRVRSLSYNLSLAGYYELASSYLSGEATLREIGEPFLKSLDAQEGNLPYLVQEVFAPIARVINDCLLDPGWDYPEEKVRKQVGAAVSLFDEYMGTGFDLLASDTTLYPVRYLRSQGIILRSGPFAISKAGEKGLLAGALHSGRLMSNDTDKSEQLILLDRVNSWWEIGGFAYHENPPNSYASILAERGDYLLIGSAQFREHRCVSKPELERIEFERIAIDPSKYHRLWYWYGPETPLFDW